MSYSSLYGIKHDYTGKELYIYENSWLFSPVIWDVLSDKTLPRNSFGHIQSVINFGRKDFDILMKINNKMNNSENMSDRICFEICNQLIFFTKDKECIAENIRKFVEQNKDYDKSTENNLSSLEKENVVVRFNEIADDIINLDEKEYPYFVFKNTSADDIVEFWFYDYNKDTDEYVKKSIKDWDELLTAFVVIENNQIVKFISNLDYQYE